MNFNIGDSESLYVNGAFNYWLCVHFNVSLCF